MSDGGRGRASLGVEVWKSCQKWSAQRSAVRSIAWLDELEIISRAGHLLNGSIAGILLLTDGSEAAVALANQKHQVAPVFRDVERDADGNAGYQLIGTPVTLLLHVMQLKSFLLRAFEHEKGLKLCGNSDD